MRHTSPVPLRTALSRILPVCILLLLALCGRPSHAVADTDTGLAQGELSIEINSGYGGYALPVANSALARRWTGSRQEAESADWAISGNLTYQLAYDYSTVPVYVRIEHRRPEAFSGRVEVVSAHGFHSSETGGGFTTVSQEFIAPPSVPLEFCLAPRCSPPSRPGGPLRLLVRLYQSGMERPLREFEQQVMQFEPAHLYSLLLDAAPGTLIAQELNRGNRLRFDIPSQPELDPAIYTGFHYIYACERQALTSLPLAARQFAFAMADLRAVQTWPQQEQDALLAFVISGGRLLLYSSGDVPDWNRLSLTHSQPLGRGWLLTERGGLETAAARVQRWLEGELEEFVLHAGGSADGWQMDALLLNTYAHSGLRLGHVFGVQELDALQRTAALSHRAGFLHPLWIARTASDTAGLEPWDYPEFSQRSGTLPGNNANLRFASMNISASRLPRSLPGLSAGDRTLPAWWLPWLWAACAAAACLLFGTGQIRRIGLILLTAAAAGSYAFVSTAAGTANESSAVSVSLLDCAAESPLAVERLAQAASASSGMMRFELPAGSLLRRVDSESCAAWNLADRAIPSGADGGDMWTGSGLGRYAALRSDNPAAAPSGEVAFRLIRHGREGVQFELSCPGLPPDSLLLLQSSLGWQALRSSPQAQSIHLNLSPLPLEPGKARQQALERLVARRQFGQGQNRNPQANEALNLLTQLLAGGWPADAAGSGTVDDLTRLGWSALLQDPLAGRGLPVGQVVLYYARPAAGGVENRHAAWVRLTLALPPQSAGGEQP